MGNNNFVLIGTFVKRDNILCFIESLKNDFLISSEKVYVYEVEDNSSEYLVTFTTNDKDYYLSKIEKSNVFHLKKGCIFSINALNKLVDSLNTTKEVPNEKYQIKWEEYKNTLIISRGGTFHVKKIDKVNDKTLLFK